MNLPLFTFLVRGNDILYFLKNAKKTMKKAHLGCDLSLVRETGSRESIPLGSQRATSIKNIHTDIDIKENIDR
jgi:hypothetical protein